MNARRRSLTLVWRAALALGGASCADVLDIPDDRRVVGAIAADGGRCIGAIPVRVLADAGGPFDAVEGPFLAGVTDYLRELDAGGGLRGCALELDVQDAGYDVARAQQIYDDWKGRADWGRVAAIFTASTGATLQLAPQATVDRKPLVSGSYLGALASPLPVSWKVDVPEVGPTFEESAFPTEIESVGYPYTFFTGTDYSTGGRVAMYHVKSRGGRRVGFVHCSVAFCTGPLPALRTYAREIGLPIGRALTLELDDPQPAYDERVRAYFEQELARRDADPAYVPVDWLWMGNTTPTTARLARAVARANAALGLRVQIMVNSRGIDENLHAACGPDCVGLVHGVLPSAFYGDLGRGPEMAKVMALHDKRRRLDLEAAREAGRADPPPATFGDVNYVQGYASALAFRLAVERALDRGLAVTGENLKGALESFQNVETGGLTDRLSFTPDDHRPQSAVTVYTLAPDGALVTERSESALSLQKGWLGW
ncbi:MAG TPA: ABC transporter substrate-binding protein [Polyangiaceae bacterium]|nr:ABC transporter substrate-binding protein [Polyangiaceae bacterium]